MAEIVLESEEDVEDLVRGCSFMGTGGGGRPQDGLRLLRKTFHQGKKIRLVPPAEISDDVWICTGSYVGSIAPRTEEEVQKIKSLGLIERMEREIVQAAKELEAYAGVKIGAIAAIELGGLNTPAPLDAAAHFGLPSIDGDFAGRAVPETIQFRFSMAGMKIWPRVFCDYSGNVTIIKEAITSPMMERIQKHVAMASFGLVGAAGHLMQGNVLKQYIVPRTISRCLSIGQVIRKAKKEKEGFAQRVAESIGGWVLFQGKVTRKVWQSEQGYMIGEFELAGGEAFNGQTLRIWFKNENHISWLDGKPFVTSPDLLSVIDLNSGDAPTNTDIKEGDRLGVIGLKATEGYRTAKGLEVLGPSHFGFKIEYVPIEERVAQR